MRSSEDFPPLSRREGRPALGYIICTDSAGSTPPPHHIPSPSPHPLPFTTPPPPHYTPSPSLHPLPFTTPPPPTTPPPLHYTPSPSPHLTLPDLPFSHTTYLSHCSPLYPHSPIPPPPLALLTPSSPPSHPLPFLPPHIPSPSLQLTPLPSPSHPSPSLPLTSPHPHPSSPRAHHSAGGVLDVLKQLTGSTLHPTPDLLRAFP